MASIAASSGVSGEDLKLLVGQACETAEKFVRLYYDKFDKQRHLTAKLYLDTASLTWDGTTISGQDNILKFHEGLPASEHTIDGFDAQPLNNMATGDHSTFLVMAGGSVKFHDKMLCFSQTFLLTVIGGTCKIASDCYRTFS
jgi:hypothetical protein